MLDTMLEFVAKMHEHYGRYVEYDLTTQKPIGFGNQVDYYKNGPIGIKIFCYSAPSDKREEEKASCILAKAAMDRQKLASKYDLAPLAYNLCRAKIEHDRYLWGYTTEHVNLDCKEIENLLYDERVVVAWKLNDTLKDYSLGRFMVLSGIQSQKYEKAVLYFQEELSKIDISLCTDDFGDYKDVVGNNKMMHDDIHYENIGYCSRLGKLVVFDYGYHILGETNEN